MSVSKKPDQRLGVNIDHVATLRQARGTVYPSPVDAALVAERSGADSITLHLREDRRHIQDADLPALKAVMTTHMNLELAVTDAMLAIAIATAPQDCCLVPEKREELTTEGGLDVVARKERVGAATQELSRHGIRVSIFIDPDERQLDAARDVGATVVELHTGAYADAPWARRNEELKRIVSAAKYAAKIGLTVHAGHGLNRDNVSAIARIPEIVELNIGHAIVAQSVFDGFAKSVADIKALMIAARAG